MKRRGSDYRAASVVHARRSHITHLTDDYKRTWCGRAFDGWIVTDEDWPTCTQCRRDLDAMIADRN